MKFFAEDYASYSFQRAMRCIII